MLHFIDFSIILKEDIPDFSKFTSYRTICTFII